MSELRFREFFLLDGSLLGRVAFTLSDDADQTEAETLVTVRIETAAKGSRYYAQLR
jgi:hypothetical protein